MAEKKVLSFSKKKEEVIEEKRRSFERVVFKNFLGVYSVVDLSGTIYPIELVDISPDGCMIQMPWDFNKDKKIELEVEIALRLYFTKGSYIPALVKVKHASEFIDKDGRTFMRYGTEFDKTTTTFEALASFIDFVYKFAKHSTIDKGDLKVFYL